MKLPNYFETLTDKQQAKWKDKKGALLYYEWFNRLYNNLSLEICGAMLLAIIYYDMHAGTKPLPSKLAKVIKKDKTASVLFDALVDRTIAGSREWINRHHTAVTSSESTDDNEEYRDTTESLPF